MIVLNIDLSLLLSNNISLMNKCPFELVHVYFLIRLIWPHVASDGVFGAPKKSSMMTFASEFVRKSLTGAWLDDPEANALRFDMNAMSDASQVIHLCFFFLKIYGRVDLPPHLLGGHPADKQDQAAKWRSLTGPSE